MCLVTSLLASRKVHMHCQTAKSKCLPDFISCPTNAAVKHSFEFSLNRVLFKIFGALSRHLHAEERGQLQ